MNRKEKSTIGLFMHILIPIPMEHMDILIEIHMSRLTNITLIITKTLPMTLVHLSLPLLKKIFSQLPAGVPMLISSGKL